MTSQLTQKKKLQLFTDDCIIYNAINGPEDTITLQNDINTIATWCEKWYILLNLSECQLMSFFHKHISSNSAYHINFTPIACTSSYKYLGVHVTSSLPWFSHIESICSQASRTLSYLRRNLKSAPPNIRQPKLSTT